MNAADQCRANRWTPGTVIESRDRAWGVLTLRITAVGERAVVTQERRADGSWTREGIRHHIHHRTWTEVNA